MTLPPDLPFIVGPYRLLDHLDSGGMGTVYRARHVRTSELVALKMAAGTDGDSRVSLRSECRLLSHLDHPGVVRFLGDGGEGDWPWYVMELVEGMTLRRRLQSRWGGIPAALRLARKLCEVLGYLHARGIVHRDLKPENIVIRHGGGPVLVDFGLASTFRYSSGREPLAVAGLVEGSCGYMAPEQICGDPVDARADLYALGCIMYEMVAGTPVFAGEGWEVLRQHLAPEPPPPPSSRSSLVPRALDDIILGLLAKRPEKRTSYADDVGERIDDLLGWRRRAARRRRRRPYLYRPEIAGRQALLRELEQLLFQVKLGSGRCVLVGGEGGAGKTRIAAELATMANYTGFQVVTSEAVSVDARGRHRGSPRGAPLHPFKPFLQALADHLGAARSGGEEAEAEAHRAVLAAFEQRLMHGARSAPLPGPAVLLALDARQRLAEALQWGIRTLTGAGPLLLVLDDLQWADELTLDMLAAIGRGLKGTRLLVVGAYRTEEVSEPLQALLRVPGLVDVRLEPLDDAAVEAIVGSMLGARSCSAPLAQLVAAEAAGNPFLVAESLRAAMEEGLVERDGAGRWQVAAAGELAQWSQPGAARRGPRELLGRRLDRLGTRARGLLELASVLGREVDRKLLADGEPQVELEQALQELQTRNLVSDAGEERLRFTHDRIREVTYQHIDPDRLGTLHRVAAERLEAQGEVAPPSYAALAHHWLHAGERMRGIENLEKAGQHAFELGANVEAAELYGRAVAEAGPGVEVDRVRRARWELMLGECFFGLGDNVKARSHLGGALQLLGRGIPGSRLGRIGMIAAELGRQALRRLGFWRGAAPGQDVVAQAASRLNECHFIGADLLGLVATALLAVGTARAGDPQTRKNLAQLGLVAGFARQHWLAEWCYGRATAPEAADAGDALGRGIALWLEAYYRQTFGQWEKAEAAVECSIQLLRRLGNRRDLIFALAMRSQQHFFRGRSQEALPDTGEVRALARAQGNSHFEAWSRCSEAEALVALGRPGEAVELLRETSTLVRPDADSVFARSCQGVLALAQLRLGATREAEEAADAVLALARSHASNRGEGRGYEGAALVYLALWEREGLTPRSDIAARALEACRLLERTALLFPLARPRALRCRGMLHWLSGRPRRARATWSRGLRVARRLRMPYEVELIQRLIDSLPESGEAVASSGDDASSS